MADDPRASSDTEELPRVPVAFEMRGREREASAGAAARAAALLALVRPRQLSRVAFDEVTAEARQLGVRSVEPSDHGRSLIEDEFGNLGSTGERATQVLRALEKRPDLAEGDYAAFEVPPSVGGTIQTIRAYSASEREVVETEQ